MGNARKRDNGQSRKKAMTLYKLMPNIGGPNRTVSLEAAEKRTDRINGSSATTAKSKLLENWQTRWERQGNPWTKRLIPDVTKWCNRKHGEVNHYFTQILTGHGIFNTFRHRIGKSTSPRCWFCDAEDTAEHTLMECPRWETERTDMEAKLERKQTPDNFLDTVTHTEDAWDAVDKYSNRIMKEKAKIERQKNEEHRQA